MKIPRTLTIVSLLAVLVVIYFYDIIFSGLIFSFRDLSRYYYPLRLFAFSQFKVGVFPFWNPYVACGHPVFAALQSVILYPLSLVYCLFNFDFAFNFFIILHIFLGGLFFYLLMRDLKFNQISSFISGLTFMFGGYLIAVINLTTTLAAAVWFPLVFLFYRRTLEADDSLSKFAYLVVSSVFLGLMFLGGEPTPMYATIFSLGVYSLMHVVSHNRRGGFLKVAIIFISFIVLFILLFSFQIFPFVELIRISNRSQSLFSNSTHWSFPPRDIINLIMPFFYGPLHFQKYTPMRQDWLLLVYTGVIPLMLFFTSLFFAKGSQARFFKILFACGLIFIFGRFTPIYKIFYKLIPGFSFVRYPVKFFFLSAVSFSYLTGYAWQEYTKRIKAKDEKFIRFIKIMFICGFICALAFFLFYLFKKQAVSWVIEYLSRLDLKEEGASLKYLAIFNTDFFNFRRMLLFFILGSFFLFLGAKKKIPLTVIGAVISALIFIDLYGVKNIEVNPAIAISAMHQETPNIAFLKKDKGMFRVYTSFQMNKANEVLRGGTYDEAFKKSLDDLTSNRLIEYGIYDTRGYFSIHNSNYSKVLNLADTAPLPSSTNILNMLNAKYILTPNQINDPRSTLVNRGVDSYLYENLDVLGRAYLVSSYVVLKKEADIAARLKSKKFLPQKEVILEEDPRLLQKGAQEGLIRHEYIKFIKYAPQEVIIETNVSRVPKFLVLADNYYPGWQVFIDGRKDKIYKANFILRGVYLGPGKHTLKFIYSSFSFKLGVLISLLTLISLMGTALFFLKREKHKK